MSVRLWLYLPYIHCDYGVTAGLHCRLHSDWGQKGATDRPLKIKVLVLYYLSVSCLSQS